MNFGYDYKTIRRTKLPNDAFKRCKCNTVMIRYIFCDGTNAYKNENGFWRCYLHFNYTYCKQRYYTHVIIIDLLRRTIKNSC